MINNPKNKVRLGDFLGLLDRQMPIRVTIDSTNEVQHGIVYFVLMQFRGRDKILNTPVKSVELAKTQFDAKTILDIHI